MRHRCPTRADGTFRPELQVEDRARAVERRAGGRARRGHVGAERRKRRGVRRPRDAGREQTGRRRRHHVESARQIDRIADGRPIGAGRAGAGVDEDLKQAQIFFRVASRRAHAVDHDASVELVDGGLRTRGADETPDDFLRAGEGVSTRVAERETEASDQQCDQADHNHQLDERERAARGATA